MAFTKVNSEKISPAEFSDLVIQEFDKAMSNGISGFYSDEEPGDEKVDALDDMILKINRAICKVRGHELNSNGCRRCGASRSDINFIYSDDNA